MIEVVFSDLLAGSLKAGYKYNNDYDDIIILPMELMLDIGYLADGIDSRYRRELPGKIDIYDFETEWSVGERAVDNYVKLKEYILNGEEVRIWYEYTPSSLCGFYCICAYINGMEGTFYSSPCPFTYCENGTCDYIVAWPRLTVEQIYPYTKQRNILSREEIAMYAGFWESRVKENSYLRTNVGGYVMSVPENYYDPLIFMYLTGTVRIDTVLPAVVGKTWLPVNTNIIYDRIRTLIKKGEIILVTDHHDPFYRYIRKA